MLDYLMLKGNIIIFADADDFFTPGFNDILNKYKDQEFDMVVFQAISLHSETYQLNNRANVLDEWIKLYENNKKKGEEKLKYQFGEPWCRIINRRIVEINNIRFQEVKCHNDTAFAYHLGHLTTKLIVDKTVGYVITYREDSVVNTKFNDRYETEVEVFS